MTPGPPENVGPGQKIRRPGGPPDKIHYLYLTLPYKPGLAMEREARFYSYAVALYGYLLCVFRTGEL